MSSQTIDGVPGLRSLIERVTSQDLGMSAKKDRAEAAHELRALLDAPVVEVDADHRHASVKALHDVMHSVPSSSLYSMAEAVLDAGYTKATQPQGEPVAYVDYRASGGVRWRPWEHGNLPDGAPLFSRPAEQPAPVAFDFELAAQKLASCLDCPWEHMPEQGRDSMREHAKAIVNVAAMGAAAPCKHCGWPHINETESCDDATSRERGKS